MKSDNSREEEREVKRSDVRVFSQPSPNLCNFSFAGYFDVCTGVILRNPRKVLPNKDNQKVLKSSPKDNLCSIIKTKVKTVIHMS